jgi:peptidoglycan/LPS O-acetylase OafA/YrhL
LQPRVTRELRGSGRYLRVSASGGDGLFAVAELAVAALCPPRWPPVLGLPRGTPIAEAVQTKAWTFAILAVAFILAYRRRAPDFVKLLVVLPAGFAIALVVQLVQIWPPPSSVLVTLAATCGLVLAALALRLSWRRFFKKPPESPESA